MKAAMVRRLISKYGEGAKLNDVQIRMLRARSNQSLTNDIKGELRSVDYTGIQICFVYTHERVSPTDIFTIGTRKYRVLVTDILRGEDRDIYSASTIFEDDFTHDIYIHRQRLKTAGVNLPDVGTVVVATLKARVRTTPYAQSNTYTGHNAMQETHVFSVLDSQVDMQVGDLVKWGVRDFEILGFENVNEQGRLFVISTIEVLSA